MEEKMKLSSPWEEYVKKLDAFFAKDDDIDITFQNGEEKEIKIRVEGEKKAEALEALLPKEKQFGNVSVKITIIPANNENSNVALLRAALEGNEAVSFIESVTPPFSSNSFTYVVFEKEVVQYWNDNLGDYFGLTSTLYQDLAKEIFADVKLNGVYFCTDEEEC